MNDIVIVLVIIVPIGYIITMFLFDLLLRGFAPLIPSRPWVVEQILDNLELKKDDPYCIALSTGRSGFFHALEKKYPKGTFIGVETGLFAYLVSKVQTMIRKTKIKVIRSPIHRVNYTQADFVYSHLKPDTMRGNGRKMKFECKPETVVVSTGFNYANLDAKKAIDLPDRKGRFDWLSKNQKLFSRKSKMFKKEKKAFFYEV
ncbi:MAG: hypothetical protein ACTSXL_04455 [Alphaproteobacteria bacterium]